MANGELHEVSVEIGKLIAQVEQMSGDMRELREEVQGLTALKHRGAGLLVGVGIVASAIGSIITWVLSRTS